MKKDTRSILKYLIFICILIIISAIGIYFKYPTTIANTYKLLGEKSFLVLHRNNLALKFLGMSRDKNLGLGNEDFETYFLLGRVYFVENNLSESIKNYTKAIELNPDFKENYYGRGLAYGFASPIFYTNAEEDFKKYIDIDNANFKNTGRHAYGAWAGYNDLSWIYFLEGDFENSEIAARDGLKISGSNPWLKNMLGTALLAQKKCDEAKDYLEDAKKLIQDTTSKEFGEAYSGDKPELWAVGKKQMENTIIENLKTCEEN